MGHEREPEDSGCGEGREDGTGGGVHDLRVDLGSADGYACRDIHAQQAYVEWMFNINQG
mgnify:CR=1 FL=1